MWKESYRLGVETIDRQHKSLFEMVNKLLEIVQSGGSIDKAKCESAITYLKHYALEHFRDEEDYQLSINYPGLAEHRKIHQGFVRDVLSHEKKMSAANYDAAYVKDFLGMLIAWLVYHVAGVDQQIVAGKKELDTTKHKSPIDSYFYICTCEILSKLTGISIRDVNVSKHASGDLFPAITAQIDLSGDVSGTVTYRYTQQLSYNLINCIASFKPTSIDELVCSAMSEVSNIISVRTLGMMTNYGFTCSSGIPETRVHPAFLPSAGGVIIDTAIGTLQLDVSTA